MRSLILFPLRTLAIVLCFGSMAGAALAQEAKAAPLSPQQRIDNRQLVIYNGTTRTVRYDLNGLPPDRAALYRGAEYLENEVTLNTEVQSLKAINVRMATLRSNFGVRFGRNYHGPYYGGGTDPYSLDNALSTIAQLQLVQENLLKAEQDAARAPGQIQKPPVPPVPPGERVKPPFPRNDGGAPAAAKPVPHSQASAVPPSPIANTGRQIPRNDGGAPVAAKPVPRSQASAVPPSPTATTGSTTLQAICTSPIALLIWYLRNV